MKAHVNSIAVTNFCVVTNDSEMSIKQKSFSGKLSARGVASRLKQMGSDEILIPASIEHSTVDIDIDEILSNMKESGGMTNE